MYIHSDSHLMRVMFVTQIMIILELRRLLLSSCLVLINYVLDVRAKTILHIYLFNLITKILYRLKNFNIPLIY